MYFNSLREEYRLQATDICITNAKGSDPMSLVKYAIDLYKNSQKVGNDFDFVFCVFDKDDHANYKQAINEISKIKNKAEFHAITSVPCFEFWLLLHFCCKAKPFRSVKDKSAAEQVVCELQNYIPRYKKGDKNTFELTKSNLNQAIKHAKIVNDEAKKVGTDNPSTMVVDLVETLISLSPLNKESSS